jgi:hypothetical protein
MPAVPAPEPDCWLHPAVEVRQSPIAGEGLFAREPIPAGTAVSRLGGRLVSWGELQRLFARMRRSPGPRYIDTIAVTEGWHLVLPPGTANGKGNHSCDPNLWWVGPYALAARRDIAVDEELTSDYATFTTDPAFTMSCRCGTAGCRGTVTGQDWRLAELRQRYRDHWVPVLAARLRGAQG